jgi:hypothetical protein
MGMNFEEQELKSMPNKNSFKNVVPKWGHAENDLEIT